MIDIALIIIPILLGYFIGSYLEKKHYTSINKREKEYAHLPVIVLKKPLVENKLITDSYLVAGNVVISIDYFKRFIAGLRNIFGGNISVYESLLDRARREAILRMKQNSNNANEIINVRIETSSISKNSRRGSIGSVEVFAYGTALKY
ncbi:YbjQ family protein [Sulfurimonas sp.]|uniref:YbjQ family protein n=1 Tax=Sulfurimonas sp. TaxID=2022749 RepID=UPI002B4971FF|nr:YbjQ family protein [Sulfurimonas sp.]